jgi:hypothetical protein
MDEALRSDLTSLGYEPNEVSSWSWGQHVWLLAGQAREGRKAYPLVASHGDLWCQGLDYPREEAFRDVNRLAWQLRERGWKVEVVVA